MSASSLRLLTDKIHKLFLAILLIFIALFLSFSFSLSLSLSGLGGQQCYILFWKMEKAKDYYHSLNAVLNKL